MITANRDALLAAIDLHSTARQALAPAQCSCCRVRAATTSWQSVPVCEPCFDTFCDWVSRGYTTDSRFAVKGEGACVDDVTLARFADEARARHVPALTDADTRDLKVIRDRLESIKNRRAA